MVSDHDQRQLALIDHSVARFQQGDWSISHTISTVEALIDHMQEVDDTLLAGLSDACGVLEECYAAGLYHQDATLYALDRPDIHQACASLRQLVSSLLSP